MPKHKLESHRPHEGHGVMSLEELNANDHLCPHHEGVAELPDANRETWHKEESNPYPMQPREKPE